MNVIEKTRLTKAEKQCLKFERVNFTRKRKERQKEEVERKQSKLEVGSLSHTLRSKLTKCFISGGFTETENYVRKYKLVHGAAFRRTREEKK